VQGRGSDHKICSPHEIIKASVIMDKKDIEKAKLIIHIKYSIPTARRKTEKR
jgi:hypothetical protein